MNSFFRIVILALVVMGCGPSYLTVKKVSVGPENLASRFARSPDPMEKNPPVGEKLYIGWNLPRAPSYEGHEIRLKVIYKDLSEDTFIYPIHRSAGLVSASVIGDKFKETDGFFSYQAELVNEKGETVKTWSHQMWVNILK